jgi:vacuolar-type H+-ATPase subunit E/Vma4
MSRLRGADAGTRREALARLAREAVARLPGPRIDLLIGARDLAFTADPGWTADLAAPAGTIVSIVASDTIEGGCIARTADGYLSFDNTYAARVRRFEPAWRQALIDLIQGPAAIRRAS